MLTNDPADVTRRTLLCAGVGLLGLGLSAPLARVMAAAGWGARPLLMASATTWVLGFVCFAWRFAPILTQPRQTSARSLPIL